MGRKTEEKNDLFESIKTDKREIEKKNLIMKIRNSVMNILSNSSTLKEFENKAKLKLRKLEFINKVQRHKLDIKIRSWMMFNQKKWLNNYKIYPNPNPGKKKTLAEHVYYTEYEMPDINISSNSDIKNFIEAESLFKYLDLTKLKKEKNRKI